MVVVNRCCMVVLACVFCWAGLGSLAWADWSACQSKPTQSCLLEEAFRGENGPLKGKERLDVLLQIDVANQVEYTTTADIEEAQRLAKDPRGLRYLYFAIRGLAAANRWEDALDEAMSATSVVHGPAFAELTRALVKAGHQDMVLDFAKRMPPSLDRNYAIAQFAEALARVGKIDDALALIREVEGQVREINAADMLIAVAQAYASRGDTKQADQFFDKAQTALQAGLQKPPPTDDVRGIHRYEPIGLRFALISLLALRGDPPHGGRRRRGGHGRGRDGATAIATTRR